MFHSFENLDPTCVKNTLIFLDIDGTLLSDNQRHPSPEVKKQVAAFAKCNHLWLCTNSGNHTRNEAIEKETGIPLTRGHRKPSIKILEYVRSEASYGSFGSRPSKAELLNRKRKLPMLVIGDKVMTDGLFAWRIGAKFIKVKRKTNPTDRLFVRMYNLSDDIIYNLLKPWGMFT